MYLFCCIVLQGWGCGYRTLQSLCSWVRDQLSLNTDREPASVPSIPQIQEALVAMGDKEESFRGSKTWIGSFEVCLCLDYFYIYDVSKIDTICISNL